MNDIAPGIIVGFIVAAVLYLVSVYARYIERITK